jgi:hypothetical protein
MLNDRDKILGAPLEEPPGFNGWKSFMGVFQNCAMLQ